jgi:cytochrome c oxidase assembly factor CtaG/cytochrome c2
MWGSWPFEPGVLVPLLAIVLAYTIGLARLWHNAGIGRGIGRAQAAAFAGGWLTLVAALASPLHTLSEELFVAHMVQHELLMIVAAPLIVAGAPVVAIVWLLPSTMRRRLFDLVHRRSGEVVWSLVTAPAAVWLMHAVALWVWHLPALFQATLESDLVHAAQHLSFLGSAVLFWWSMSHGRYGRLGYGAAVIYVFATAVQSGVLGALLTFAPHAWYPVYATTTSRWGLNPLEDQQLGGLIMWVPAGVVYTIAGLGYFAAWLRESERRSRQVAAFVFFACVVCVEASACGRDAYRLAAAMTGGDPARGRDAITRYGCDTCHVIPGVKTARGQVGPPLTNIASRVYLAGEMTNTPDNMQKWIRHPRNVERDTAMPDVGVTDSDARDLAAYLYTLR